MLMNLIFEIHPRPIPLDRQVFQSVVQLTPVAVLLQEPRRWISHGDTVDTPSSLVS